MLRCSNPLPARFDDRCVLAIQAAGACCPASSEVAGSLVGDARNGAKAMPMKLTPELLDDMDCRPLRRVPGVRLPKHVQEAIEAREGETRKSRIIEPDVALRNILTVLQQDPFRYRWFGVWWWPVKALLKGAGYTRGNLYLLGDYVDRETAALVPPAGLQDTLRAALAEYGQNARYGRGGGRVESPDGEIVMILDSDAL